MRSLRLFIVLLGVAVLPSLAQTAPKTPRLLDPELRLEVFATAPDIEAPTTVAAAPDGSVYVGCDPRDTRLNTDQPVCWIVRFGDFESPDLIKLADGSLAPPGPPRRQRTVFADKLYSPAGSQWHDGWLYVIHDPLMTRFKDTDGDGVADVREDLITNLGLAPYPGLNDHVVSGFVLGMDGFFYISVGDRGIYKAKGKDGSELTMQGGGIIRCRPDGTQLEIFSTGTRNHLAVLLDAEDNAFTRDNTDDGNGWWTRLTHHIEGGYFGYPYDYRSAPNYGVTQPSPQTVDAIKRHGGSLDTQATMSDGRKVFTIVEGARANPKPVENADSHRQSAIVNQQSFLPAMADFGGGSPTGGLCYLSDGLPEKYRGKLLFAEWGKGALHVTEVARDGATFRLVKDEPLIQSEKGADFRPLEICVAADGSLLIADWGWGGWKAPKKVGTIWRLSRPEARPAPRLVDESKASVEELIAALGHPDRGQRLRAQGTLAGNGEASEKLALFAKDQRASETQRIHSVWALKAMLDRAEDGDAEPLPTHIFHAFKAENARVRTQGARAIGQITRPFQFELLAPSLRDADPAVRLQVATALGRTYRPFTRAVSAFGPTETTRLGKTIIGSLTDTLADDDDWVRFAARKAFIRANDWQNINSPHRSTNSKTRESVWLALGEVYDEKALELLLQGRQASEAYSRVRAVTALGRIAYQPKPYDGHWWGTQPVKNPRPLNSVPWTGTPQALGALTTALVDSDAGVRLAAARAFAGFEMGGPRSVVAQTSGAGAGGGAVEKSAGTPGDPKNSTAPPPSPTPDQGADGATPSKALDALRARLTAETDAVVRRQLIEALGVQKDAEAVGVFQQIALDETADPEFRDTAIGAVVNIGGAAARETIAQIAGAKVGTAAARKIIEAAGELKVLEAAPALIARLQDENAGNREAAVKALARLGPQANARESLIAALQDRDDKVQTAAVEALGNLRDAAAVPALVEFAKTKRAKRQLIEALAKMPDAQSLPLLLDALRDANSGIRRPALAGLKKLRAEAWPQIEANLASGRIPAEFAPEIRAAFESGVIVQWKMIGVFENVWDAVHPPESDAVGGNVGGSSQSRAEAPAGLGSPAYFLAQRYESAEGKSVGWIDVNGDPNDGRVDLARVFNNNGMVRAYAFAEIESPEDADAKLICGSDDQIAVWLNGRKVHDSGPGTRGFNPEQDQVPIRFAKGRNALFVKIGNQGGDWQFSLRIPGVEGGKFTPAKEPPPEEKQRAFALAAKPDGSWLHPGDAARGEKLFHDPNAAMGAICATCHAVRGKGGTIGPDLTAIGTNYRRPELIVSIFEPAKTIALGFEQVLIETKGGETIVGALRQESADALTVVGADGASRTIAKADVKTKTDLHTSLMPPGLTMSLKPEDFVDLLAYMESLRGAP